LHPLPVCYCPEYPGLRCEELITTGGGQGLKEVALYLRAHHAQTRRAKIYDTPYVKGLLPWYEPQLVAKASDAEYLLSYLSEKQRNVGTKGIQRYSKGQLPLLTVDLRGVRYAELYRGPRHPDYKRQTGARAERAEP
jgi:hypothetical protein